MDSKIASRMFAAGLLWGLFALVPEALAETVTFKAQQDFTYCDNAGHCGATGWGSPPMRSAELKYSDGSSKNHELYVGSWIQETEFDGLKFKFELSIVKHEIIQPHMVYYQFQPYLTNLQTGERDRLAGVVSPSPGVLNCVSLLGVSQRTQNYHQITPNINFSSPVGCTTSEVYPDMN